MNTNNLNLTLMIWRQRDAKSVGSFQKYEITCSPDSSILEVLDEINDSLERKGEVAIHFESDCREGICGTCGLVINGEPHGPLRKIATCQLHMRNFKSGETIYIEPYRAKPFPIIRDLIVDRASFDKILEAGGYVSLNTGGAQDANALPVNKESASNAFDAAACIGCGACVASCKNASAMLFVSAKVSHLAHLPQGQVERYERVYNMVKVMDELGFGACTNTYACEAECPKGISVKNIALMNRDYLKASFTLEKT